MNLKILASLIFIPTIAFCSAANAETSLQKASPIKIAWTSGLNLKICALSDTGALFCGKSKMPGLVGKVRNVYQANFVSSEVISWLVVSKNRISICGITSDIQKVSCVKAKIADDIDDFNISFQNNAFHVSSANSVTPRSEFELYAFGGYLMRSVMIASAQLYASLTGTVAKTKASAYTLEDEDAMRPMTIEEPDCDSDCEVLPGDGGSGGGDGGGGGAVVVIVAPLPAVPAPPVPLFPPPTTPFPSVPSCESLGICKPAKEIRNPALYEERMAACWVNYEMDMDECQAYSRAMDKRSVMACRSRAADRLSTCQLNAERDP